MKEEIEVEEGGGYHRGRGVLCNVFVSSVCVCGGGDSLSFLFGKS